MVNILEFLAPFLAIIVAMQSFAIAKLTIKVRHYKSYKDAVIDECVSYHIYSNKHEENARAAINDVICIANEIALDPKVSSDAEKLVNDAYENGYSRAKLENQNV